MFAGVGVHQSNATLRYRKYARILQEYGEPLPPNSNNLSFPVPLFIVEEEEEEEEEENAEADMVVSEVMDRERRRGSAAEY